MLKNVALADLSKRIMTDLPLQVAVGGEILEFTPTDNEFGPWCTVEEEIEIVLDVTTSADHRALRWVATVANRSARTKSDISITPLLVRFDIDPQQDHPRVRHLSGSHHYDGVYPPRAFCLFEERFMTHDHCRSVRIENGVMGSAGAHVPVLQFGIGRSGAMTGLFVGFEWSLRWHLEVGWARNSFEGEPRPELLLQGNVGLDTLELAPGESLILPAIHMGFFEGAGWDDLDRALRQYVREELACRLDGQTPTPPVPYDHWFGIHASFDVEDLKRQAEQAAQVGCEAFCLDASWYYCPLHWLSGIGNWRTPDPRKFPNGIAELSEHVRQLGMKFGIWHQIEVAAPETDMLRDNPKAYYKGNLRLDLHEGQNLALSELRRWINEWQVTWMRWECSPSEWQYEVDPSGKLALAYVEGLYKVIDTIRAEHPDLYIEICLGGGTKLDLGTIVRTHGAWLSDHTAHPDVCRFMQTGASRFWPAHFLNSAVRVHRGSGDVEVYEHNFISRMVGTLSLNGDIAQWSPAAAEQVREFIAIYKSIRHLLSQSFYFPLPQPHTDADWDVVLVGDSSQDQLLFAFRMEGTNSVHIPIVRGQPRRLLGDKRASILSEGETTNIQLPPNSSALWCLPVVERESP